MERAKDASEAIAEGRAPRMSPRPQNPTRPDAVGGFAEGRAVRDWLADTGIPEDTAINELARVARESASLDDVQRTAVEMTQDWIRNGNVDELYSVLRRGGDKEEGLLSFLHRTGGVVDDQGDLKHLGLTPKVRPGLLRKQGRSLDEATRDAWEAGFLVSADRPEINDLLDAIRTELHGGAVVREGGEQTATEMAALDALNEALIDAGIDVRRLGRKQFREALGGMNESLLAGDVTEAINRQRASRSAQDAERVDAVMDEREAFDALAEADVRRLYEGREDTVVTFETEDGLQQQTIRDLYDELDGDYADLDSIGVCVGRPI